MRKKILIALLSFCALGSVAVSGALLGSDAKGGIAVQAETVRSDTLIADRYVLGETFELPQDAKLEYNGKSYDATVTLRDPDGRGHSGESVLLTVAGKYTLEYQAVMENGALLKESKTFDCCDTLYSINGKSDGVHYGVFDDYADTEVGLAVELSAGETLKINKMLDLSGLSYNGGSFEEIIGFYVAPNVLYSEDVSQLHFTLTDAYDAENSVTVVVKKFTTPIAANEKTYAIHSYMTAGAVDQQQIGMERTSKGDFDYGDGNLYKVHKNNFYGSALQFSMTGGFVDVGSYVGKDKVSFTMNYEEGQIYSQTVRNGNTQRGIITDLDDRRLYDELWEGFTTGEVYLSVKAMNYKASSCRFVITDLLGVSDEVMQANAFKDEKAPTIAVDFGDETEIPSAIVNTPYPVFNATAQDNYDGDVSVNVSVWENYKKSNAYRVSMVDGKFTPQKETDYYIVYTATDRAGNQSEEVVAVPAVTDIGRITIELGEKTLSGKAGEEIPVATPTLLGGTGNKQVRIRATHKDDESISYTIDGETLAFLPLYAGTYEIAYTYSDYLEEHTETYEIAVANGVNPYIADGVRLPKYVLKNGKYTFPTYTGYVFGNGETAEKTCTVLVRQDNGTITALANNTVVVTASENLTVIYQLNDGANVYKREYAIPVIDTGFAEADQLDLSKYFYSETVKGNKENNNVLYTVSGADGESANMKFIKPLLADNFCIDLGTDLAYTGFDAIRLTLTDSENAEIAVTLTVLNHNGKAVLQLNDEEILYDLEQNFFDATAPMFSLAYSEETRSVAIPSGSVKVRNTLGGGAFNGFESHFVHLEIDILGIEHAYKENAGIRIYRVNNQAFTGLKNDIIEPEMTVRTMRGIMLVGGQADILPMYAADVVDPYVSFTMRVTDPDGEVVTATDGTVLDGCDTGKTYTVSLDKYGRYTVYYIAMDSAEWSVEYSYVINVGESEPPVIKLTGAVENAKLGETVKIAKAEVTDNVDEALSVVSYLKTPSGIFHNLQWEGVAYNAFVAKETGVYTVYYYAVDTVGNYTIESYTVTVA